MQPDTAENLRALADELGRVPQPAAQDMQSTWICAMMDGAEAALRRAADRIDQFETAAAKFDALDGIGGAACSAIRDLLRDAGVPEAAFIDDFVAVAIAQRDEARHVVRETLWMAGRYANGRQTYAVKMYNDARKIAEAGGYASKAEPAVDGGEMGTPMRIDQDEALARVEALAAARRAAAADRG